MKRIIFILMTLFLIASCAIYRYQGPKRVTSADLNSTHGILMGTFSRDSKQSNYMSQAFYFKNVKTDKHYEVKSSVSWGFLTNEMKDDFNTPDSHGDLFTFSLPAGDYVLFNFNLFNSNGYFHQSWGSKKDFAIPFTVEANKVNYLGEIQLMAFLGENLLGIKVPNGGIWVIRDKSERDLALAEKKLTKVPLDYVNNVVPQRKDIFTPLVLLPSELKQKNEESSEVAQESQ